MATKLCVKIKKTLNTDKRFVNTDKRLVNTDTATVQTPSDGDSGTDLVQNWKLGKNKSVLRFLKKSVVVYRYESNYLLAFFFSKSNE